MATDEKDAGGHVAVVDGFTGEKSCIKLGCIGKEETKKIDGSFGLRL